MTRSLGIVACLTGLIAVGHAQAQQRAPTPRLVGTWRLVSYENVDEAGRLTRPYGNPPLGFFVYDAAGNVFIQISKNPPLNRVPGTDDDSPLPGASSLVLRETLEAYIAYFGTYSVDSARKEIVHRVVSDVWRDYSGTEQRRSFRLMGDTLVIGDGKSFRRVLVRVPNS
ncbi:MAG: lipocalin-like domain-containing protein [Gemmatimonadaceae bacterium]